MAVYFMNNNQRVIKIVGNEALREVTQTQELPDDGSLLKDMLTASAMNDERLDDAQYMAVESYTGNKQSFDMYRIVNQRTEQNWTTFDGVQLAYYELDGAVVEDVRPKNAYIDELVPRLLKGTDWTLGYVDDNLPRVNTHIYYLSVKDALAKVQSVTGVEMIFKVEISGNQVTDKWVEVYERLGDKTLKRFNYGTNALTIVRETSHQDLFTALIGRGKGEEVSSAEDNESGQAGYGRKITFRDVEWSKAKGKPLDKPKGQLFLEQPEATEAYGIQALNGEKLPRVGIVEYSDTEDPNVLIQQTYEALEYYARPKVLFKASVVNIGATGIGDTVTIHRHDLNIHYQTRVRKVIRNKINDNRTQVELGDVVHTSSTKKQANINSALNNLEGTIRDTARNEILPSLPSANGVNQNFYQNEEPERKRTGDLWYRDHPSLAFHTQLLMWNGEAWELLADTSDKEQVNRRIDEQEGLLEKYSQDLTTTAELAEDVSKKANQLEQNYQDVKASTDSAMNKAVDAYTDAQNALAGIGDLDRTVTNHGASILQNERNISLKADRTDVDTLNEIIETNSAELSVLAGEISAKADKMIVDNLNQTVENLSAEQIIHADMISERLTRSEVNAEIERRVNDMAGGEFNLEGYAQVEYVENLIENTADSFSQSIENVKKLVPTSYENRNLILRSTETPNKWISLSGDMAVALNHDTSDYIKVEPNTEYTLTKNESELAIDAGFFRWAWYDSDMTYVGRRANSNNEILWKTPDDVHYVRVSYPTDSNPKLEKGTKATPYSIAPEDLQNDVTILRSDYERTSEEVTDRLTKIDGSNGYISEIRRDVGSLTSSITEYEQGTAQRFNVIESDVKGTKQLVANLEDETSSQFNVMSDEISAVVGKVNNIGGRNLIRNSNDMEWLPNGDSTVNVSDSIQLENGQFVKAIRGKYDIKTYHQFTDKADAVEGETYTFSMTVYNGSLKPLTFELYGLDPLTSQTVNYQETKRITFTGERNFGHLALHVMTKEVEDNAYFHVINPKLEKGEVATDWSPAPEDGVSKNELISEINIQANRQIFRVGDNRLMITEDTTYLDNAVIKSAHIADLAVTGAKIADASISSAKIINLDVDKISGNSTNFIKSNWNNISTQIAIDDRGINITGSSMWRRTYINQTGFQLFNGSGADRKSGVVGFLKGSAYNIGPEEDGYIETRSGITRHAVGIGVSNYTEIVLGTQAGAADNVYEPSLEIRGDTGDILIHKDLVAGNQGQGIKLRTQSHRGSYGVTIEKRDNFRSKLHLSEEVYLEANYGITFHARTGQRNFRMHDNNDSYQNLSMQGNSIVNQSDERLKTNIMPSFKDSLGRFNKANFKWFEYLPDHNLAGGLHHGLIAQEVLKFAPEWVIKEDDGYYTLDYSIMLMDAFKAIQQLSQKVKKLEAK